MPSAVVQLTPEEAREYAALAGLRVKYRIEQQRKRLEEDREQELDRYHPRGAVREMFYAIDPQLVINGPSSTGKSRGCLEKLHRTALDYPGMRGLLVRKTRTSLTQSAMVTFQKYVLGPMSDVYFHGGNQEYRYPNGSVIVAAGLDNPGKALSTEYDIVYVQQAEEMTLADWETLATRKGRPGSTVIPHPQLLADCNPGAPTHWLKQKADNGEFRMLESRHEDNPMLWDAALNQWTPAGAAYIAELDKLTGARKQRLRFGRWAGEEGQVYDGWDASKNVVDHFDPPASWPRYRVVDFGYTNPFSCQFWAIDPDGRLYLYRELYGTGRLVEDWANDIFICGIPVGMEPGLRAEFVTFIAKHPDLADNDAEFVRWLRREHAGMLEHIVETIADHDAEDRATLEAKGIRTSPAIKDVSPGIQAVQARIRPAGDGKPRLFFMRDALVERDQSLQARGKPCSTLEEIDGYVWEKTSDGKPNKEAPRKLDDHGMDGMRYMVVKFDRPPKSKKLVTIG